MFETIIRILGGMLTAHELSGDAGFLTRCACLPASPPRSLKLAGYFLQSWPLKQWKAGDENGCTWAEAPMQVQEALRDMRHASNRDMCNPSSRTDLQDAALPS